MTPPQRQRTRVIARVSPGELRLSLGPGSSTIGGGSAPGSTLPTRLIAVSHPTTSAALLEARLRSGDPPVVARIEHDRVLLDLRTVFPEQEETIVKALSALLR